MVTRHTTAGKDGDFLGRNLFAPIELTRWGRQGNGFESRKEKNMQDNKMSSWKTKGKEVMIFNYFFFLNLYFIENNTF